MSERRESLSDRYLHFSRTSLALALGLVLVVGGAGLAVEVRPEVGARWMTQLGWALPLALVVAVAALQRTLRGERWRPDAPAARAVLDDEWRQASVDRAFRLAFVVVLAAQVPLGLSLASLPALRAVLAMATATSVLGLASFLGLALVFGREVGDER